MLIDTGSLYIWVPGYNFKNHEYLKNKPNIDLNVTKSIDYFGDSNITFSLYKDDFFINNKNIKNVTFGLTSYESNDFIYKQFDGIMGLGNFYDNNNGDNGNINNMIYYNIYKQTITKGNLFSLYINYTKKGQINKYGGKLSFGYYNKIKKIKWLNLIKDKYRKGYYLFWAVELSKIEIENKTINININNSAIIDSGTSEIVLNKYLYNKINKYLGGKYIDQYKRYIFEDCKKLKDINIYLQEKDFLLKNTDYTFVYNNTCYSRLIYNENEQIVLGLPFLQRYYSIYDFDNKIIGFSRNNY